MFAYAPRCMAPTKPAPTTPTLSVLRGDHTQRALSSHAIHPNSLDERGSVFPSSRSRSHTPAFRRRLDLLQAFAQPLRLLPVHAEGTGVGRAPFLERSFHLLGGWATRERPDLHEAYRVQGTGDLVRAQIEGLPDDALRGPINEVGRDPTRSDRKSTRLNSSHANISYAVFCLKKKKIKK